MIDALFPKFGTVHSTEGEIFSTIPGSLYATTRTCAEKFTKQCEVLCKVRITRKDASNTPSKSAK